LNSKLNDMMVRQLCGYTLITQPEPHFIESSIPDTKYRIFDNEVYEFKALKTLVVANFNIPWTLSSCMSWLHNEDDGIWINDQCKQIYVEPVIQDNTLCIKCHIGAYIKPHDFTFYQLKFSA